MGWIEMMYEDLPAVREIIDRWEGCRDGADDDLNHQIDDLMAYMATDGVYHIKNKEIVDKTLCLAVPAEAPSAMPVHMWGSMPEDRKCSDCARIRLKWLQRYIDEAT